MVSRRDALLNLAPLLNQAPGSADEVAGEGLLVPDPEVLEADDLTLDGPLAWDVMVRNAGGDGAFRVPRAGCGGATRPGVRAGGGVRRGGGDRGRGARGGCAARQQAVARRRAPPFHGAAGAEPLPAVGFLSAAAARPVGAPGAGGAAPPAELMAEAAFDGALVGCASLGPDEFSRLVQYR